MKCPEAMGIKETHTAFLQSIDKMEVEVTQMDNLTKALIYASYMHSILSSWTKDERSGALNELDRVLFRFMHERKKKNPHLYLRAMVVGDTAWFNSINHFQVKKIPIEGAITIIKLHSHCEAPLLRFAHVTEKRLDKFSLAHYTGDCGIEVETNAGMVVTHLVKETMTAWNNLMNNLMNK